MNADKTIKTQEHYPVELQQAVEKYNADVNGMNALAAEIEARLEGLRDPEAVTPANAEKRLAALTRAKADELALLARRRDSAAAALVILKDIRAADAVRVSELTEAAREREAVIRDGMAKIGVTDALTVARAVADDAEIRRLRGEAVQAGGNMTERAMESVTEDRQKAVEEIARLLA